MRRTPYPSLGVALLYGILAGSSAAQVSPKAPAAEASSFAERGIGLAQQGRCKEALPTLKKAIPHLTDKDLRFDAAMMSARCAMSLNQTDTAVEALLLLNREFPRDPKVLYLTTHYFSELASRASQELAATAPDSTEAHKLDAEAYESQGKWDEAAGEYSKILQKDPQTPEIHFRLGRILLSRPPTPTTAEDAKKEFEAELKIDPTNAAAEFMLGDLARKAEQWDEAIDRFSRASKLDAGFSEAFLGLGISLNAAGRYSDAIPPLERYVKIYPPDPAGHYQLAIAYMRVGRKQDAAREMALQREAEQKAPKGAPATQDPTQPQ